MAQKVSTRKPRPALVFAGTSRNHEARRKEIVRELRIIANGARYTVSKAEQLIAYFEGGDLNTLRSQSVPKLRDALRDVTKIGGWYPTSRVSRLLGFDNCKREDEDWDDFAWRVRGAIYGWEPRPATPTSEAGHSASLDASQSVVSKDSPGSALNEAMHIVARAADEADAAFEIDWTENPSNEREAALRRATIEAIVEKHNKVWGAGSLRYRDNPQHGFFVLMELSGLAPSDAKEIGADLYDATEHWRQVTDQQAAQEKLCEEREIRNAALRKLRGEEHRTRGSETA